MCGVNGCLLLVVPLGTYFPQHKTNHHPFPGIHTQRERGSFFPSTKRLSLVLSLVVRFGLLHILIAPVYYLLSREREGLYGLSMCNYLFQSNNSKQPLCIITTIYTYTSSNIFVGERVVVSWRCRVAFFMSMCTPPGVPPLYIIISFTSSSTSAAVTAAYVRVHILQKKKKSFPWRKFFFSFPLEKIFFLFPLRKKKFFCLWRMKILCVFLP